MFRSSNRFQVAASALAVVLFACKETAKQAPVPELDLTVRAAVGEVRAGRVRRPEELIGGPIAKGRVGDYKLYNDKVTFIIAGPGAGNGYSPWGGKVVDADLVRPAGEPGRSNFGEFVMGFDQRVSEATKVTVVSAGGPNAAGHVRVEGKDVGIPLLDVILDGIITSRDHTSWITLDYILEPNAEALRVETTLENVGAAPQRFEMRQLGLLMGDGAQPFAPGPGFDLGTGTHPFYAAVADSVSYGIFDEDPLNIIVGYQSLLLASQGSFTLEPKEKRVFKLVVAVGAADTASLERAHAALKKTTLTRTTVSGRVQDAAGLGVAGHRVHALGAAPTLAHAGVAPAGADGRFTLSLPPGEYTLQATSDVAPGSASVAVSVGASPLTAPALVLPAAGVVLAKVTDQAGADLPGKLVFKPVAGDAARLPAKYGMQKYAGGATRIVYSRGGQERVRLQAGRYKVTAARGFEYTIAQQELEVPAGGEVAATFQLQRVVDTTGYLSGDFHIHSQSSPDSDDLDELKVSAFAAEGLEVPVSTEHESVADYAPTIARLGMQRWMRSIIGEEVTTFSLGHFNAFPLAGNPNEWNNGAVRWHFKKGPEIFAAIRANAGRPLLQVNHPRSAAAGGYFSATGFDNVTRTVEKPEDWSFDFDAIEVVNGKRVVNNVADVLGGVFADWYSFLNGGKRVTANGNSDSHQSLSGAEVGYPRNYVKMPSDDLAAFDERVFVDAVRRGQTIVSGGLFFTVTIGGKGPGGDVTVTGGRIPIDLVVQSPPWMDVTQIVVVGNGEVVATRDVTAADADPQNPIVRFRGNVEVAAAEDTWYVVHVRGTRSMDPVVTGAKPWAFSNPIYVDVDGNGTFTAPDPM